MTSKFSSAGSWGHLPYPRLWRLALQAAGGLSLSDHLRPRPRQGRASAWTLWRWLSRCCSAVEHTTRDQEVVGSNQSCLLDIFPTSFFSTSGTALGYEQGPNLLELGSKAEDVFSLPSTPIFFCTLDWRMWLFRPVSLNVSRTTVLTWLSLVLLRP